MAMCKLDWTVAPRACSATGKLHRLAENVGAAAVEKTLNDLRKINNAFFHITVQCKRHSADRQKLASNK